MMHISRNGCSIQKGYVVLKYTLPNDAGHWMNSSGSCQVVGNLSKGLLFVLSAPAGTGKTTLVQELVAKTHSIIESISYTTRLKRKGESEGVHYHFIDEPSFQAKVAAGDFLEYVELYGNFYGTSRSWVEDKLSSGKHVILVIDTQGALKLMAQQCDAVYIFLAPPSLAALRQRLERRATETPKIIDERLHWSSLEFQAAWRYDYIVVNDDKAVAVDALFSIIAAEEHRLRHLPRHKYFPAALIPLLSPHKENQTP